MGRRWPLHIHVTFLFVLLILAVGALLGAIGYRTSRAVLATTADELVARIGETTRSELSRLIDPAEGTVALLRHDPLLDATRYRDRVARLAALREALDGNPAATSVYVGYPDGDFFLLRRLVGDADREALNAPPTADFLLQTIDRGDGPDVGRFAYFDGRLRLLRTDPRPDYPGAYDPRERPWFAQAGAADAPVRTEPYRFFSDGAVGVTVAVAADAGTGAPTGGAAVVGLDVRLARLDAALAATRVTPGTEAALVGPDGRVIARAGPTGGSPAALGAQTQGSGIGGPADEDAALDLPTLAQAGAPALAALAPRAVPGVRLPSETLDVDGAAWRAAIHPLPAADTAGGATDVRPGAGERPWSVVVAIPEAELFAAANELVRTSVLATIGVSGLAAVATWLLALGIAVPLRRLARDAEAIERFEFDHDVHVRSRVLEVHALYVAMRDMKAAIRRFLDVNRSVAETPDIGALLAKLLGETMASSDARGGLLLLAEPDGLRPAVAAGADRTPRQLHADGLPAGRFGPAVARAVAERAPQHGETADVDADALGAAAGAASIGAAPHLLAVPLVNRDDELVGVLALAHAQRADRAKTSFLQAVAASTTTTVEARRLIDAQRRLFDAFIQLLADAIDAKSPYTGRHRDEAAGRPRRAGRRLRVRRRAEHRPPGHDGRGVRAPGPHRGPHLDADAGRPRRDRPGRGAAQGRHRPAAASRGRADAGRPARPPPPLPRRAGRGRARPTGRPVVAGRRGGRPRRAAQPPRPPRHPHARGPRHDRGARRTDHRHALAPAVPRPPPGRARGRRRAPRTAGRHRLPARPDA